MKKLRVEFLAAVMLLTACESEDFLDSGNGDSAGGLVPMTFTADILQTRTQLAEGNTVHWTEGDQIAVWKSGGVKQLFTAGNINGSSATFTGEVEEADSYFAFYPYNLANGQYTDYFKFTIMSSQTAAAGTFSSGLAPSWAKTENGSNSLQFHNLCALVKFTVGADMAGNGAFTLVGADPYDKIAGNGFKYYFNNNKLEPSSDYREYKREITLSGNFEAGQSYYIVVAPANLTKGFSLLYESGEGKLYRKVTTKSVNLQAGHILNLGTLETSKFEKAVSADLYKTVFSYNPGNFDGTVTISESELADLASKKELNVSGKDIKSLAGIGYCSALTKLDCSYNYTNLTHLYIGGLTELTELDCSDNYNITSLDVSGLTKLSKLTCRRLVLNDLDVSGLNELTELDCGQNNIKKLVINGLPKLSKLDCSMSNELTELNLSDLPNLTELYCNECQLTVLDVRGLTGLTRLDCWQNYNMTTLYVNGMSGLEYLNCNYCSVTELNLSGLTGLTYLDCNSCKISELDIREQSSLETLGCGGQSTPGDKGGDPLILTLTLTSEQKVKWDNVWKDHYLNNMWEWMGIEDVVLNVKD